MEKPVFSAGQIGKTDSGITVMYVSVPGVHSISLGFFVKVGSSYETLDNNGVAHFLEHMAFAGTKDYTKTQLSELLDSMGTDYNAMTSKDFTAYIATGLASDWEKLTKIFIQIYGHPTYPQEIAVTESKVVLEELKQGEDSPLDNIVQFAHAQLYGNMGFGLPIVGTRESLAQLDVTSLVDFHQKWYVPQRTVVCVVGDSAILPIDKIYQLINDGLPHQETLITPDPTLCDVSLSGPQIFAQHADGTSQTQILLLFKTGLRHPREFMIMELISDVLASGMSSKLYKLLRDELSVSYTVNAYQMSYAPGALFGINTAVDPLKIGGAVAGILDLLQNMKTGGKEAITKSEFAQVKKLKSIQTILALTSTNDYMMYYALDYMFTGSADPVNAKMETLKELPIEEYQSMVDRIFRPENLFIFLHGQVAEVSPDAKIAIDKAITRLGESNLRQPAKCMKS
jgi:predicted Zn-dependent peptidase